MKDKDFDKIFSEQLNDERAFPFAENDWEMLSARLDEHDRKRIVAVPSPAQRGYFWPAAAMLLLLLTGAWGIWQMNNLKLQNAQLHKELGDLKTLMETKPAPTPAVEKRDTVVIIKYVPYFSANAAPPTTFTKNTAPPQYPLGGQTTKAAEAPNFSAQNGVQPLANPTSESAPTTQNPFEPTPPFGARVPPVVQSAAVTLPAIDAEAMRRTLVRPTAKSEPRFLVGANYGLINYKTSWRNANGIEVYRNEQSFQAGLKAEFVANSHWRIIAGADFCPFDFKIYWFDDRYNLPQSLIFNPSQHRIREIRASQNLYQGFLGAKYVFISGRWRPYASLAYSSMMLGAFDTHYTFRNSVTNQDDVEVLSSKRKSIANLGIITGGIEYRLARRVFAQAEGFYYHDMNRPQKTYDLFGARATILWGF